MDSALSVEYARSAPSPGDRGRLGWGRLLNGAQFVAFLSRRSLQAVKRSAARFPTDFVFPPTEQEFTNLRSQFVTLSWGDARKQMPSQNAKLDLPK